ncbi:V/A-type H+-transporting ATPase subunit B [Kribbella sp. VKM Ac-2569]|uniref:V-type ATP synthase subunit B n=1 Tax=Kribbella sp. VKM Ac-2569 TaxID=2512220 RepID=UPI00102B9339|nr:V-type ATP synthase subunit B [Kribbella sp. VKM Ac-2569]RZT28569.1 V/A-type H+-transporting ATPase subunit B [Kribbella sp. VKM Ac-2569]
MTTTDAQSPFTVGHRTVTRVAGPLIVVDGMDGVGYGELVEVETGDGPVREGQVLELDGSTAIVQVFGGTVGIGRRQTSVLTRGRAARTGVGNDYFGRVLDGAGRPRDGGPQPVPDDYRHVNGLPLNPITRAHPDQFIETGVSAIDGLITLVRGQKLPIFSGAGLPANSLAARIAAQARVPGDDAEVVVIFAAMGVTRREAEFFRTEFLTGGAAARSVLLLNLADDPTIERLLTPRVALTMAEYLAFEQHRHVLVVMTDMTAYCEALREISAAREEMPGRRGYPGYMYTDLASLYERAGRVRGGTGSLTQLMILTMPDDDITHPIPDLTGYITEGQIVLSRDLDRQGIQPPIDVLPSLSRLMNAGIGVGKTRDDHRGLADQLYACYARGREVRRLMSIVGESGLPTEDRRYLAFAAAFERTYLGQGPARRTLTDTLEVGWQLLAPFPAAELKRVSAEHLAHYHHEASVTATDA